MPKNEFQEAGKQHKSNLARELLAFLGHTKKWWLTPIILLLLLLAILIVLGGSAAAPFIYTLF